MKRREEKGIGSQCKLNLNLRFSRKHHNSNGPQKRYLEKCLSFFVYIIKVHIDFMPILNCLYLRFYFKTRCCDVYNRARALDEPSFNEFPPSGYPVVSPLTPQQSFEW